MKRSEGFSVKEIVEREGTGRMQELYIMPRHLVPSPAQTRDYLIPIIDLTGFNGPNRPRLLQSIAVACRDFGIFQVVNHGIAPQLMADMIEVARDFFALPVEEKLRYFSEDAASRVMFGTSFNLHMDTPLNWRDFLKHDCTPLEEVVQIWPNNPPSYRKITSQFSIEVRKLSLRLLSAIFETLGINPNYIDEAFGKHLQRMGLYYYPPCLNSESAFGLAPHYDYTGISVILQEENVSGLQIHHGDYWVPVHPIKDALVVSLGDQIEIMSNGRYESIEHCVVLNSTHPRISIATGYSPSLCTIVRPAPDLIDEKRPPLYKEFVYHDYTNSFKGFLGERTIDSFRR